MIDKNEITPEKNQRPEVLRNNGNVTTTKTKEIETQTSTNKLRLQIRNLDMLAIPTMKRVMRGSPVY